MATDDERKTTKRSEESGRAARSADGLSDRNGDRQKTSGDAGQKQSASRPGPQRTTSEAEHQPAAKKTASSSGAPAQERRSVPSGTREAKSNSNDSGSSPKPSRTRMNSAKAAREAMNQLQELTNRDAEGIVGLEKNDDGGWNVIVEVVENRRIPNTADVLAEYSVTIDADGDLTSYSRDARYARGRTTRGG